MKTFTINNCITVVTDKIGVIRTVEKVDGEKTIYIIQIYVGSSALDIPFETKEEAQACYNKIVNLIEGNQDGLGQDENGFGKV